MNVLKNRVKNRKGMVMVYETGKLHSRYADLQTMLAHFKNKCISCLSLPGLGTSDNNFDH